jgi:hypothetical protein
MEATVATPPKAVEDLNVAIAVLYERMGNVIDQLKALETKIDGNTRHRDEVMEALEARVSGIEKELLKARWFLAGIAASGGAVGGGIAGFVAGMVG